MDASIIGLIGSVLVVATTYWFTKRSERSAEWRKEKLAYYKTFVESLSGIVGGDTSPEGNRAFTKSTNNLQLFAPQPVIIALNEFRDEIRVSNSKRTQERHDRLLAELFLAIRHDIGVFPPDDPSTFNPRLWASGTDKGLS